MNPAAALEAFLRGQEAESVTFVFFWLIIGAFFLALYGYKTDRMRGFAHYAPNLLTSLGILGTFIGIVIGLMHFNPSDIDSSIVSLLGGLETAFMTSLLGMAAAITFKVFTTSFKFMQPGEVTGVGPEEIGPEDIHASLQAQSESLEMLRHAIAGDEDGSLVSQLKLLRSDNRDIGDKLIQLDDTNKKQLDVMVELHRHSEQQSERFERFSSDLEQQLKDFADMLSRSATETVVNALKEVIADFNKNLTEQFGENFKALDASVQKLVEWQENYRHQLEDMKAQYDQGVQAITQTEQSVTHISEKAGAIPDTMEGLKTLLETTRHQLNELSNHLEAFKGMRDAAVEAVPTIREQVDSTVRDVSGAAQSASEHYKKLLDDSDKYIEAHDSMLQEFLKQFQATTQEGVEKLREDLTNSAKDASDRLIDGAAKVNESLIQGSESINTNFGNLSRNLTQTSDTVASKSEQIAEQFDDALKEVNNHVRNMGETLTKESQTLSQTLAEASKQTEQHIRSVQTQVNESIEQMQQRLTRSVEEMTGMQTRQMNEAFQQMDGVMRQSVQRTGESVNSQLKAVDESMQQELDRVMTEMGNALTQISGRFTQDYQRLTQQMQQVVQTANSGQY
ncbi:MotA/TolQ/ExbB proton channel family protein [Aidingimonas lacisalsi]|uniref:MotA/TolQ/ExbB proton channel family protein n=1 Tax=Aidingimonas lacisalsi TaxID=2604086 RepID=UPI0011D2B096|nr:MotA/TolQ/ExbB proton channel family protein [Aidingimonas lacisalsi]